MLSKPLKVFVLPLTPFVCGIDPVQLFSNPWRKTIIDKIVRELSKIPGYLESTIEFKPSQTEKFLIELRLKGSDPRAQFLGNKCLKYLGQSIAFSVRLVSGGFINESNDSHLSESPHDNVCCRSYMKLLFIKRAGIAGFKPNAANLGDCLSPNTVG